MTDGQSASLSWCKAPIWGLRPNFYYCQTVCGFADVGRSVWRENRYAVYNCCWSSPAQSFLGPRPAGLLTIFYCLRFETPKPGGPGPRIYIPQEQGGPITPQALGAALSYSSRELQHKTRFATISLFYRSMFTLALHRKDCSSTVSCMLISAGIYLPCRCLAMNFYTGSAIPPFRRHATIEYTRSHVGTNLDVGAGLCIGVDFSSTAFHIFILQSIYYCYFTVRMTFCFYDSTRTFASACTYIKTPKYRLCSFISGLLSWDLLEVTRE
jgi:hypothetical protein